MALLFALLSVLEAAERRYFAKSHRDQLLINRLVTPQEIGEPQSFFRSLCGYPVSRGARHSEPKRRRTMKPAHEDLGGELT